MERLDSISRHPKLKLKNLGGRAMRFEDGFVDRETLVDAMRAFKCVSGAEMVLRAAKAPTLEPFLAPIVQSNYQLSNGGAPSALSIDDFELLSLAARCRKIGVECPEAFEGDFPKIDPADLWGALAEASAQVAAQAPAGASSAELTDFANEQTGFRGGLQLVGFHIVDRDVHLPTPLRLTNARLPFSVRLIGCVIDCALFANNCELVSFDLSGSALNGLDANFLKAQGSVRLRRTFSSGPVDFAGARVNGYFDATDSLVMPLARPQGGRNFVADRGAFNLSQTVIENELFLNRVRIWGGLCLKGATINRTIFMDDAIVRSPIGVVERAVLSVTDLDLLRASGEEPLEDLLNQEDDLAGKLARLSGSDTTDERKLDYEKLAGREPVTVQGPVLRQLLEESMRARTSAIRADGMRVEGSVFARRLKTHGRIRLKYARISGGLHLEGSWLRSMDASARVFERLRTAYGADRHRSSAIRGLLSYASETYAQARRAEKPERDGLALDLGEVTIGGNLNLGSRDNWVALEREHDYQPSLIDGMVSGARCEVSGKVDCSNVQFAHHRPRTKPDVSHARPDGAAHQLQFGGAVVGDNFILDGSRALAGLELSGATVAGSLTFGARVDESQLLLRRRLSGPEEEATLPSADALATKSRGGSIGRLLARARQARLGARLDYVVVVPSDRRARSVTGAIDLHSTRVEGDVLLVFDPSSGPTIDASGAEIAGALSILPARGGARGGILFSLRDYERHCVRASMRRRSLARIARTATHEEWESRYRPPGINLTDCKATAFCHPPRSWPQQDGLELAGFSYVRTNNLGPLAPYPYFDGREEIKFGWVAVHIGLMLLALALVAGALTSQPAYIGPWLSAAGWGNCACLAGLVWIDGIRSLAQALSPPRARRAYAMADRYLARQVSRRNRFRTPGWLFRSLAPYAQAARALREEGRPISADLIDIKRLKERTKMLSWRLHFLAKFGLLIMERASGYGLQITRTAGIALCTIVVTMMVAQHANTLGFLTPQTPEPKLSVTITSRPLEQGRSAAVVSPPTAQTKSGSTPQFNAFAYAFNKVVPIVKLDVEARWELKAVGSHEVLRRVYEGFFLLVQLIGWGLTSAFVGSIAVQTENILSRGKD